jgi:hypothetical protein
MPDKTANDHEWPEWEQETAGDEEAETWTQPGDRPGESADPHSAARVEPVEPADPLATLRDAERIQVWRTKPTWCRGLLCTVDLAADEEIDLGQLKEDWGGGVIQLRPMQHTSQGWKYARGAVSIPFTGPPRERGVPLGSDGEPRVIEAEARPVAPPPRALATRPMGGDVIGTMAQLFERITDRLDGLERRMVEGAPGPPDPLAEVKRAAAMVHELRGLAGVFAGEPIEEPDEADDDEEEPEGDEEESASPEAMLMRLLEKKLTEDEAKPEATPQPASGPRLIKAPRKATPPPAPAPAPAPAAAAAAVIDVEPEPEPEPAHSLGIVEPEPDPWTETVPPELRAGSVPAPSPQVLAPIVEQLKAMPTDQAMELLDQVVRSLPKEQVIGWIQAMQQAR